MFSHSVEDFCSWQSLNIRPKDFVISSTDFKKWINRNDTSSKCLSQTCPATHMTLVSQLLEPALVHTWGNKNILLPTLIITSLRQATFPNLKRSPRSLPRRIGTHRILLRIEIRAPRSTSNTRRWPCTVARRALHRNVYGGAIRVSTVPYEGCIFKVQACDGTVTAADGHVTAL